MRLTLTSPAFDAGHDIPALYTCDGANLSPPLSWSGVPAGTKSLALIVADPDAPDPAAPQRTWVHWVLYNLPPHVSALPPDLRHSVLPQGAREGMNDWQEFSYGGPCPPIGRHRYVHQLYALDLVLPTFEAATKRQLEQAMQGHILEQATLIGLYQRP